MSGPIDWLEKVRKWGLCVAGASGLVGAGWAAVKAVWASLKPYEVTVFVWGTAVLFVSLPILIWGIVHAIRVDRRPETMKAVAAEIRRIAVPRREDIARWRAFVESFDWTLGRQVFAATGVYREFRPYLTDEFQNLFDSGLWIQQVGNVAHEPRVQALDALAAIEKRLRIVENHRP